MPFVDDIVVAIRDANYRNHEFPQAVYLHPVDWMRVTMDLTEWGVGGYHPRIFGVPIYEDRSITQGQFRVEYPYSTRYLTSAVIAAAWDYHTQVSSFPSGLELNPSDFSLLGFGDRGHGPLTVAFPFGGSPLSAATDLNYTAVSLRQNLILPDRAFCFTGPAGLALATVQPGANPSFHWIIAPGDPPVPLPYQWRPTYVDLPRVDPSRLGRRGFTAAPVLLDEVMTIGQFRRKTWEPEPGVELGGEPARDIVDEISALVDGQLTQESSGYDHNINQAQCPYCDYVWHGLPITQRMREMRIIGAYDEKYKYSDDTSAVICAGSERE